MQRTAPLIATSVQRVVQAQSRMTTITTKIAHILARVGLAMELETRAAAAATAKWCFIIEGAAASVAVMEGRLLNGYTAEELVLNVQKYRPILLISWKHQAKFIRTILGKILSDSTCTATWECKNFITVV